MTSVTPAFSPGDFALTKGCSKPPGATACTPVDVLGAKKEDIVVVGHNAVHEAIRIQPGALGFRLAGSDDVGEAKQLQQLLAVPVHVCRRCLVRARRAFVGSP